MKNAILTCSNPLSSFWQLGKLPPRFGRVMLIGWTQVPRSADSSVPEQVAKILSRALAASARVVFPSSSISHEPGTEWTAVDEGMIRSLVSGTFFERMKAAFTRTPSKTVLVSTDQADVIERLFDDAGYPWHLPGQIALCVNRGRPLPDIDRNVLLSLIGDRWIQSDELLASCGIVGVWRPGVDGAVAGMWSLDTAFEKTFMGHLRQEAECAGFDCVSLEEAEFSKVLADA
jgi:hypothetical protein